MDARPALLHGPRPDAAVLSFDLEDWEQHSRRRMDGSVPPVSSRVLRQVGVVQRLLDRHRAKATFFVLGTVAERFPDLVRELHADGHEIASHGTWHIPFHRLDPDEVRQDIAHSLGLLREVTGAPVLGFRAPEFSISARNPEVLAELVRQGVRYDSSIYPIRHRRYGVPSFPRVASQVHVGEGRSILELPLATWSFPGTNLPVAGGGYFRFFPGWFLHLAVTRLAARGELPVLYFHPYEFDEAPLTVPVPPGRGRLRKRAWQALQNVGRHGLPPKLDHLLTEVPVVRCRDVLERIHPSFPGPAPESPTTEVVH